MWRSGVWVVFVIIGSLHSVGCRTGVLPTRSRRVLLPHRIHCWRFSITPAVVFPSLSEFLKHAQSVNFNIYLWWTPVALPTIKLLVPILSSGVVLVVPGKETRSGDCARWWGGSGTFTVFLSLLSSVSPGTNHMPGIQNDCWLIIWKTTSSQQNKWNARDLCSSLPIRGTYFLVQWEEVNHISPQEQEREASENLVSWRYMGQGLSSLFLSLSLFPSAYGAESPSFQLTLYIRTHVWALTSLCHPSENSSVFSQGKQNQRLYDVCLISLTARKHVKPNLQTVAVQWFYLAI